MATTREQLAKTLTVHDPDALRLVLRAAEVDARGATAPDALADRIAEAIWWNYNTPLGFVADRGTLEEIVLHLARRLGVEAELAPTGDVWGQIRALTAALVQEIPAEGVTLAALGEDARARLDPSWAAPLGFGGGATGSFGARWASAQALALLRTPIGRLLPLIPVVGPWVRVVRTGIGAVYLVSGPLGIALTVLSVNSALSTNYRRLVPLVLGVGALGPTAVPDAQVVA